MAKSGVSLGLAALVAAMLIACTTQGPSPPAPLAIAESVPASFPEVSYLRLRAEGRPVFRVESATSVVVMEVRRSGSLARFGHDHVVASHDVGGYVAPDEGRADLYLPLDALVVDEQPLRVESGFETQPSAADIAGTRSNMLTKVLESSRYPYVLVELTKLTSANAASTHADRTHSDRIRVTITLHGATRATTADAAITTSPDGVHAEGKVAIKLSDFGMTPFSTLGGALAIQDDVIIRYTINASPWS